MVALSPLPIANTTFGLRWGPQWKWRVGSIAHEKSPKHKLGALKVAATYSPTTQCSTIGDAELNDPVRNGKGWDLSAITT